MHLAVRPEVVAPPCWFSASVLGSILLSVWSAATAANVKLDSNSGTPPAVPAAVLVAVAPAPMVAPKDYSQAGKKTERTVQTGPRIVQTDLSKLAAAQRGVTDLLSKLHKPSPVPSNMSFASGSDEISSALAVHLTSMTKISEDMTALAVHMTSMTKISEDVTSIVTSAFKKLDNEKNELINQRTQHLAAETDAKDRAALETRDAHADAHAV